ncbi:hypothetical protein BWD07_04580 [Neisseria canis]|nr:hypothetical protein BWD07_04580 [Neisseria canis]
MSLPAPPASVSLPAPPSRMSLPSSPFIVSSPAPPSIRLSALLPVKVSPNSEPIRFSICVP